MSRLRILVAGTVARDAAHGGATWAVLQYAVGLQRLGHDVVLVEPIERPSQQTCAYFHSLLARFGLSGRIVAKASTFDGFDAVLNLSGLLQAESIASIPTRVYVDLDPAFNQLWHDSGIDRGFSGHTHFVTLGQAIGQDGCDVPALGFRWIGSLPPVVLAEWPDSRVASTDGVFTTVGNLRSYGSIERDGRLYGQKVHSLRGLRGLPRRAAQRLLLAMALHEDEKPDVESLRSGGWEFVDPVAAAGTLDAYRAFIQGSVGEIGVAKSGYVASRCGWFSDRSACYLASGRPVVAQDTGFAPFLPTGVGLLSFVDEDGAVSALECVRADYERHRLAAREIAEEHLDSGRVLTKMLAEVGA